MPDLTIAEVALALTSALGLGGTATHYIKKPGSPADHEQRIGSLESEQKKTGGAVAALELRMSTTERSLSEALGRLTESSDRLWKATDKLTETVEEMRSTLIRIDVETRVDREERQRSRKD